MIQGRNTETTARRFSTLASGLLLLATTGCGLADSSEPGAAIDDVTTAQGAILGGWTTLTPINGWQAAGGSYQSPAVGKVNGVVVFRGAVKATNPTDTFIADLPAAFQPHDIADSPNGSAISMKVVLSGGAGGTLSYDYLHRQIKISQDGVFDGVDQAAKTLTSLDGASFDVDVGTHLNSPGWDTFYGYRYFTTPATPQAHVKTVDGFVRFQGMMHKIDQNNYDTFLFNIPSQYRPGNTVLVYADVGGLNSVPDSWSWLAIYPSGDVYVDGINPPVSNMATHLEGVSFSRTLVGNVPLPMANGWVSYSARQARVGKYGDVVRFQGAVSGGTSTVIGTLPTNMRPTKTVTMPSVAYGTTAKITVNSSGVMTVDNPGGLDIATLFVSLDGVSFGL